MIKEILLPDLGEGIETVDVSEVLVSPGDNITPGDIILVLESEKASMEIPSEEKGKIQKVFVTAGDQIKAGEILIIMDIVGDTLNKKETKLKLTLFKHLALSHDSKKEISHNFNFFHPIFYFVQLFVLKNVFLTCLRF